LDAFEGIHSGIKRHAEVYFIIRVFIIEAVLFGFVDVDSEGLSFELRGGGNGGFVIVIVLESDEIVVSVFVEEIIGFRKFGFEFGDDDLL
jgi:hypothetical protein